MRVFVPLIMTVLLLTFSCNKEPKGIDGELFSLSKEDAGFVWYKNSDAFLDKSSGSGHNFPF